jgi:hypothetical protein
MAYTPDEIGYIQRLGKAGAKPDEIMRKIEERRAQEKAIKSAPATQKKGIGAML